MNIKLRFIPFLTAIMLLPCTSFAQVIAAGGRHSLTICADSTVRSWGYNGFGQLGYGTTMEQHTGVVVSGLTGVRQVAGGLFHSLFIKNDGTAWACGRNTLGPLGDGTNDNRTIPVQVSGLSDIIQAAGGGEHSLFLKNDSTVWACGANSSGQLGIGTNTINKNTAAQVVGLTGVVQLAAGAEFSLFLKNDGTVWACGHNGYGQFGNGTTTAKNIPTQISGLQDIVGVSAGEWHSLFVRNDGTVFSAGRNQFGQLGDGTTVDKKTFIQLNSLSGIVQAEAGGIHSVFLKNDGTVWSCGLNSGGNNDGQLGDGTTVDRHTPVPVISSWGTGKIIRAEATREHSLFLDSTGQVWASGRDNYGQLGNGAFSNTNASVPVIATSLCKTLSVSVDNNLHDQIKIALYPNPFSTNTVIQADEILNNATLTIFNAFGQEVKQMRTISGASFIFHRGGLPNGLYFFQLSQNNRIITTGKVVIISN